MLMKRAWLGFVFVAVTVDLRAAEFRHHFVDRELPVSARGTGDYGLAALADLDRDGDLDFVLGGKPAQPSQVFGMSSKEPANGCGIASGPTTFRTSG